MTLSQVRSELVAIEEFDEVFRASPSDRIDEAYGAVFRDARKYELLSLAVALASRN